MRSGACMKKWEYPSGIPIFGAADGTRTRTVSLPGDFKSPVSTDSTTTAYILNFITSNACRQGKTGVGEWCGEKWGVCP